MSHQPSALDLCRAVLHRTLSDGTVSRDAESHYLDFVVDGESLLRRQAVSDDLVTPLNRVWLSSVPDAIEELRGRRPSPGLAAGRIALLVCGGCGDLACGAVTASLSMTAEWVTWTGFCWENGFDPPSPLDLAPGQGFVFERTAYDAVLSGAYDRLAALPYDEPAHRGRKTLWPWQWGWRLPPRP